MLGNCSVSGPDFQKMQDAYEMTADKLHPNKPKFQETENNAALKY